MLLACDEEQAASLAARQDDLNRHGVRATYLDAGRVSMMEPALLRAAVHGGAGSRRGVTAGLLVQTDAQIVSYADHRH